MDARRAAALDVLVLDVLDEDHPLSSGVVGRLLSSRDGADEVRERVASLVARGMVAERAGGMLVRTADGTSSLRDALGNIH